MPGIYGFACDPPTDAAEARLEAMAEGYRLEPWYLEDCHLDDRGGAALGRSALGWVDAASQPAVGDDGAIVAVMTGEILDADEHRRALAAAGHACRGEGQAELALRGFEAEGRAFFGRLDGQFAAAFWDARRRRLTLVNDRWGMKPLYYAARAGELRFATSVRALLADGRVPRRQSLRGIAQFFNFGQLLGEDTLCEGVRALPAAGWLTFDAREGRLAVDRYWRLEVAVDGRPEAEHLDRIDSAFGAAVDRCTAGPGRLGLALSGGLDSRTILAATDPGREVQTLSLGMAGSLDHLCAAEMSAIAGRPHRRVLLDERFLGRFEEHLERMVALTDGHYLCQCIVMPTLPVYRELGVEVLLRGHAGELMHMSKAYNFSLDRAALGLGDSAALESWLSRRLRGFIADPARGSPFAPGLAGEVDAMARESLREALAESEGVEPPVHRIWHLFLAQRLRRETALSMAEFNSVVETRLPYLDGRLVEALMAAPPALKLGEAIQAHILRRRLPAFLGVTNANTGARVGAGRLARTLARARLKALGKLGLPGYQPYERLGLWLRRELRPLVLRLLADEPDALGWPFDPAAVRRLAADHLDGRANHTYLILALMIFATARRAPVGVGA